MERFFAQLNFSSPTWDLFIIPFFLVFSLLYGLSLGRDRILVIIVSIYMALAVVNTAPFLRAMEGTTINVAIGPYFAFRVTVFLSVFLVIFFLLSQSALAGTLGGHHEQGSVIQVILFSVLHVGLLISVTLSFLPREIAERFAPLTRNIFLSEIGRFIWIVAPILAMVAMRTRRRSPGGSV
jgi:hypothetical protein